MGVMRDMEDTGGLDKDIACLWLAIIGDILFVYESKSDDSGFII